MLEQTDSETEQEQPETPTFEEIEEQDNSLEQQQQQQQQSKKKKKKFDYLNSKDAKKNSRIR